MRWIKSPDPLNHGKDEQGYLTNFSASSLPHEVAMELIGPFLSHDSSMRECNSQGRPERLEDCMPDMATIIGGTKYWSGNPGDLKVSRYKIHGLLSEF